MGKLRGQFYDEQSKGQAAMSKYKKSPIKVTYISSPMKVKASSASEFRAIVQELTGKNSDVGERSDDSYDVRVNQLPADEEANRVVNDHDIEAAAAAPGDDDDDDQLMKNIAAHGYLLEDAFSSHLASSLELDERFLMWSSDVAADSSFGFQSSCLTLYH